MPKIHVSDNVESQIGYPRVNRAKLNGLFYDYYDLPQDKEYFINFRKLRAGVYGLHIPFTRTVYVDPLKATASDSKLSLDQVIVHETKHLADSMNRPFTAAMHLLGRIGVRAAATYGTYKAVQTGNAPNIGDWAQDLVGLEGGVGEFIEDYINVYSIGYKRIGRIANMLYYRVDPAEVSARSEHNDQELCDEYARMIHFPGFSVRNMLRSIQGLSR